MTKQEQQAAEQAHVFQGMVQGYNAATGEDYFSWTSSTTFAVKRQDETEVARVERDTEDLFAWFKGAMDAVER